jgi:hypothetical protein
VVEVAPEFVPGGRFERGGLVARIDPADYELALRQAEAELTRRRAELDQRQAGLAQQKTEVVRARNDLALEMGQQEVARREYELLGETVAEPDEALVLRRPQLEMARARVSAAEAAVQAAAGAVQGAEAAVETAEAAVRRAELDLRRVTVRAPFNATVRSRRVDLGAQAAANAPLASLVGTDEYWVRVTLPADELKWIDVPGFNAENGSPVRVYHASAWGPGVFREGRVARLMSGVEPQGRLAMLLVAVTDPLHLESPPADRRPLLLDAYVRVEIAGRRLEDVVPVDRTSLREGWQVWVMTDAGTLDIRPVSIVWSGEEKVFVRDGLAEGDMLITSDLGAPVEGMLVRTAESRTRPAGPPDGGAGTNPGREGQGR